MTDAEFGRKAQQVLLCARAVNPELLGKLVRELLGQAVRDVLNTPFDTSAAPNGGQLLEAILSDRIKRWPA